MAEFSIIPLGKGAGIGKEVARAIRIVDASGMSYKVHSMGTLLEGDLDQILEVVRRCHREAARRCSRVMMTLKIDDRGGGPRGRQRAKGRRPSLRDAEKRRTSGWAK